MENIILQILEVNRDTLGRFSGRRIENFGVIEVGSPIVELKKPLP
jgi:hypothetical protein